LHACLELALQKQPAVAARRASLAAAEDAQHGLDALGFPAGLVRELPIRKQQSELGVTAAVAGLDAAERETIYDVTRTYFTVQYARAQEKVTEGVVARLKATQGAAATMLKAGAGDVTSSSVDRASVYLDLADIKRIQAAEGVKRARAALREAIGLAPCEEITPPEEALPEPDVRPCKEKLIEAALARSGEIIQAHVFATVAALEVDAQRCNTHQRVDTFAIGADIHSRPIEQGVHNHEYRPGALAPNMPAVLVGPQCERVARASDLSARAAAVLDKTRNLIVLETEDAFYRWEEASLKAAKAKRAADNGKQLADSLNKDFTAGLKVKLEDVINAHVLAAQAQSQYNEFLYDEVLALLDLERSTAGAFCAGLATPIMAPAHPVTRNSEAPATPDTK
jgi:outer membrane protein TolC